jgi:N-acetylneuraminic acid mutarotase
MAAVPGSLIANIPGLGSGGVVNVTLNLVTPFPVNGSGISTALPFFIDGVDPAFNPTSSHLLDGSPSRTRMQQGQLSDGRLITAGGRNSNPQSSSYAIMSLAETFDPSTDKWTRIANMIFPREDHTLTVLGNGTYDNRYAGESIVIGGRGVKIIEDSSVLASRTAEIYDVSTNTWQRLADLEFPHIEHTTTRLNDGRLLVVGGIDEKGQFSAAVEMYDPNDDRWTTVASPVSARAGHRAILLDDGRVAVFGGSNETGALMSVELYDPQTNVWSDGGQLLQARAGHTLTLLNDGRILIVGGESSSGRESIEIYDPRTRQSSNIAPPLRQGVGR